MMYIKSFRLYGLILFVFELTFVVQALPSSHFKLSIRDDLGALVPATEPSSEGLDLTPLDSDVFSSGLNLNSPDGSVDLLALAPTQADSVQPLLPDPDQFGADTASSGQRLPFDNPGGSDSKPEESSLPSNTLGLGDTGSGQSDLANSLQLSVGDDPDGSSSTLAYTPSDILAPEGKLPPDGGSIPDPVASAVDISRSGDVSIFADPVDTAPGTSLSGDVGILDSLEDTPLSGDDKSFDPIDPAENAYLPDDDSPFGPVGPAANTYLSADGSISDSASPAEDDSFGLYDTEGTLVASTKKAAEQGSTNTPTCSGRKTPACCSSKSYGGLQGWQTGCIECMCVLVFSIAYFSCV